VKVLKLLAKGCTFCLDALEADALHLCKDSFKRLFSLTMIHDMVRYFMKRSLKQLVSEGDRDLLLNILTRLYCE